MIRDGSLPPIEDIKGKLIYFIMADCTLYSVQWATRQNKPGIRSRSILAAPSPRNPKFPAPMNLSFLMFKCINVLSTSKTE